MVPRWYRAYHRAGNVPLTRAARVLTRVRFVVVVKSPSRPWGGGVSNVRCRADRRGRRSGSDNGIRNSIRIESSPARCPLCRGGAPKPISNDDPLRAYNGAVIRVFLPFRADRVSDADLKDVDGKKTRILFTTRTTSRAVPRGRGGTRTEILRGRQK